VHAREIDEHARIAGCSASPRVEIRRPRRDDVGDRLAARQAREREARFETGRIELERSREGAAGAGEIRGCDERLSEDLLAGPLQRRGSGVGRQVTECGRNGARRQQRAGEREAYVRRGGGRARKRRQDADGIPRSAGS
jgi:hypothetical protein